MKGWQDIVLKHSETGERLPIVERYLLPGKGTGFVVVCEGRKCFSEFRGQFTPLGLLPTNLSPEDRKGVVKWALFEMHYLTQLSFRHAVSGEPLPDPFKGGD